MQTQRSRAGSLGTGSSSLLPWPLGSLWEGKQRGRYHVLFGLGVTFPQLLTNKNNLLILTTNTKYVTL